MKQNILLSIIIFLSFKNTSYCSFPVTEHIEYNNIIIIDKNDSKGLLFVILSVLFSLLSIVFVFLFIGNGLSHNGNPLPYLFLSILSIFSTIFSALKSRKRGIKKSKSFIGISILIISLLLIRFLIFD